jgi:tetratricopeptide (TPR) repeat protein
LPQRKALAAFAAVAVLVTIVALLRHRPTDDLLALSRAAGTTRLIESRLSGGFEHGPLAAIRGPADAPWKVLAEVGRIEEKARHSVSRDDLRALAVAEVLVGRPASAIGTLEALTARVDADPATLSDLACAYLERARREERADDLPRALDAASRALVADPSRPEALWNRALALESLHLRHQARKAWETYVAADGTSGWAEEARARLARLQQPPPSPFEDLQPARERLAAELFPAWAEAWLARKAEEPARASELTAALEALAAKDADPFDADLARYWRSVPIERKDDLARGHQAYGSGFRSFMANEVDRMRPEFEASAEGLRRAGSPYLAWARFHIALADMYAARYEVARPELEVLRDQARQRPWLSLDARSSWILGLMLALEGRHSQASPYLRSGVEVAEAARDGENAAFLTMMVAEGEDQRGLLRAGWTDWRVALARSHLLRRPRTIHAFFMSAAVGCEDLGLLHAALAMHAELQARAPHAAPADDAGSARERARLLIELGQLDSAAAELDVAEKVWSGLKDPSWRARLEPDLLATRGSLALASGDLVAAQQALEGALVTYRNTGYDNAVDVTRSLLARARAEQGDTIGAEAELQASLEASDWREARVEAEAIAELVRLRPLARDLASLRAERDPRSALEQWNQHANRLVSPFHPVEASAVGGAGHVSFVYVAREDSLLVFVANGARVRALRRDTGRAELARLGRALRFALSYGSPRQVCDLLASELFDILLGDELRGLQPETDIALVPDDVVLGIPFPALLDRKSGQRVLDTHRITMAPALGYTSSRGPLAEGDALIVGNPSLSATDQQSFDPLPEAGREAEAVARLHGTTALIGASASKAALLERARSASLVHFAGHVEPGASPGLVLAASSSGEGGRLEASDRSWRDAFSRASAVVLAACSSGAGESGGETAGSLGITRPFLAAGVPTVVATLWNVKDGASRALMLDFHRELRLGTRPSEALRRAQQKARHRSEGNTWAAFVVVGAG